MVVIVAAMAEVRLTPEALREHARLPLVIQRRMIDVFGRLEDWPAVSGAKPLRGNLKKNFRIRTGGYRVLFRVSEDDQIVTVWHVGDRKDVYE